MSPTKNHLPFLITGRSRHILQCGLNDVKISFFDCIIYMVFSVCKTLAQSQLNFCLLSLFTSNKRRIDDRVHNGLHYIALFQTGSPLKALYISSLPWQAGFIQGHSHVETQEHLSYICHTHQFGSPARRSTNRKCWQTTQTIPLCQVPFLHMGEVG